LREREAEMAAKEQQVAAREQAGTAVEQQMAASSIGVGTWTVGVDVQPGTYRDRARERFEGSQPSREHLCGRHVWGQSPASALHDLGLCKGRPTTSHQGLD
jgi:hypothetical protein